MPAQSLQSPALLNASATRSRFLVIGLVAVLLCACGQSEAPKSLSIIDPGPLTRESPLDAKQILENNPLTHAADIYQTEDGDLFVAYWSASAGRFNWNYTDINEVITILEGEAFVKTSDGITHHLKQGSTMVFGSGEFAEWHVPNYIRKVAVVQRSPRPFLRRVTDKIRKMTS